MNMFQAVYEPVYCAPDADAFQTCLDREVALKPRIVLRRVQRFVRLYKDRAELFRRAGGRCRAGCGCGFLH